MSTVPLSVGSDPKNGDDLPLFRFGLRQLFLFVAAFCTLLAALVSASGLYALVVLLAVSVVVMHVFATGLGTRLQIRTEQEQFRRLTADPTGVQSSASASERSAKLESIRSAPRSPWHGRGCTYLPWLPKLVVSAMALAGLAGSLVLSGLIGDRTSPAGIVVGAVSFAILGGWIAFLGGNFYGVFRHGFREALAEQQKDQQPRRASL